MEPKTTATSPSLGLPYIFKLDNPLFEIIVTVDILALLGHVVLGYVFCQRTNAIGRRNANHPATFIQRNHHAAELAIAVAHLINLLAPSPVALAPTPGSQILCRFWMSRFIVWSLYSVAIYSLFLSALDRYFAFLHPVWYLGRFNCGSVKFATFLVWTHGFVFGILNIAVTEFNPEFGICQTVAITTLPLMLTWGFVCFWFMGLPLLLTLAIYCSVFRKLSKLGQKKGLVNGSVFSRRKRNFLLLCSSIVLNYISSFSPVFLLTTVYGLSTLDLDGVSFEVIRAVILILPITCVSATPLIVAAVHPKVKETLLNKYLAVRRRFGAKVGAAG